MNNSYQKFYAVVKNIPPGKVATYGQVAKLAGLPRQARQVGYALSALEDNTVPWQRVVNAKGEISARSNSDYENLQKILLEEEGIRFDANGRIDLAKYQWQIAF